MNILKRKYWYVCLILSISTLGLYTFYVGKKLHVYDKEAWYSNKYFWILSFICGIVPGLIMFFIFYIEIGCMVCKKLSVPFDNYYIYPYIWVISLIIPIIGWTLFIILVIYVHFWYIFYLKRGYGEAYLKKVY
ncbi:MAG: hypothetical protein IKG27_02890 [Bacilli bacterium]|nr:hypothetical protein [Bacilli bacterium]